MIGHKRAIHDVTIWRVHFCFKGTGAVRYDTYLPVCGVAMAGRGKVQNEIPMIRIYILRIYYPVQVEVRLGESYSQMCR